jgi:hypothetical protein
MMVSASKKLGGVVAPWVIVTVGAASKETKPKWPCAPIGRAQRYYSKGQKPMRHFIFDLHHEPFVYMHTQTGRQEGYMHILCWI